MRFLKGSIPCELVYPRRFVRKWSSADLSTFLGAPLLGCPTCKWHTLCPAFSKSIARPRISITLKDGNEEVRLDSDGPSDVGKFNIITACVLSFMNPTDAEDGSTLSFLSYLKNHVTDTASGLHLRLAAKTHEMLHIAWKIYIEMLQSLRSVVATISRQPLFFFHQVRPHPTSSYLLRQPSRLSIICRVKEHSLPRTSCGEKSPSCCVPYSMDARIHV